MLVAHRGDPPIVVPVVVVPIHVHVLLVVPVVERRVAYVWGAVRSTTHRNISPS